MVGNFGWNTRRWARLLALGFFVLGVALGALSAQARPWKPTSNALALDYSQIVHTRTARDVVLVWWQVAEILPVASEQQREFLDKYTIVGIVHGHTAIGGVITFDVVGGVQASDGDGNALAPLAGDSIPPAAQGVLVALQGALQKSLGPMGQGFHWFVFEAGAVHSCEQGGLSISYDGETYTYETPIPGCPTK